jgi:hypothetical protein
MESSSAERSALLRGLFKVSGNSFPEARAILDQ